MISFFKPKFKSIDEIIQKDVFTNKDNQNLFIQLFNKEHFLNPLNEGKNYTYKKFIIISTQRSGTTLLVNLLRSHFNIVCYSEIFKKNSEPLWGFKKIDIETYKLAQKFPVDYINHYFFRNYSDNVKAVGFKYMYNQLPYNKIKKVIKCFDKKEDLIVQLLRKNKLKAFLSNKLLEKTNVSRRLKPEIEQINYFKNKILEVKNYDPIYINSQELKTYIKKTLILEKRHYNLIKNNNHLIIFYEDLENKTIETTQQIIKKLGLAIEELTIINEKQNKKSLSESIVNYTELKKEFAKTNYISFFED